MRLHHVQRADGGQEAELQAVCAGRGSAGELMAVPPAERLLCIQAFVRQLKDECEAAAALKLLRAAALTLTES